jgi:hypothetical protein
MGKAQDPDQLVAVATAPAGKRTVTAITTGHRHAHEHENGSQGMPTVLWLAWVRDFE